VGYEGYKAHLRRKNSTTLDGPSEATEVGLVVAKRAIFQATASMLFPALTIHSAVKYSSVTFHIALYSLAEPLSTSSALQECQECTC